MKFTMDDIAKESGVSKATVSYVLNYRQTSFGISDRTVSKVLQTAKKMNYVINKAAAELSGKKNDFVNIHILSPWLHSQFSDFMVQVNSVLNELAGEERLRISYELCEPRDLHTRLKSPKYKKYDGILLMGTTRDNDAWLRKNREKFTNIVLLNRAVDGFPGVSGNDAETAAKLAGLIVKGNCYRQYVIVSNPEPSELEEIRIQAFARELKNLPSGKFDICNSYHWDFSASENANELLRHYPEDGTLFLFAQYFPAASFLAQASRNGRTPPCSIGIAAFDRHTMLDTLFVPGIMTVDPKIGDMTRRAVQMCIELKRGEHPEAEIIKGEIIPGKTVLY